MKPKICVLEFSVFAVVFVVSALLTAATPVASGQTSCYDFSYINFPASGASRTEPRGINNNGQIVGSYADSNGAGHGFLFSSGSYTSIDVPGATNTTAIGINDSGQVVGVYTDSSYAVHGFSLNNGNFTTIDYPGAIHTVASGINNQGEIVGNWFDSNTASHGFRETAGSYTTINYPGSLGTSATSINDTGQIVGSYSFSGGSTGFLLIGASFTTFSNSALSDPAFWGINSQGQIVLTDLSQQGYLTSASDLSTVSAVNLCSAPAGSSSVFGINNAGQLVGRKFTSSGSFGFVTVAAAQNTLTVASTNPSSGVAIAVSPSDSSGKGNGTTPFTHSYSNGVVVTLTAPNAITGNSFSSWTGCDSTSGTTCIVAMNVDRSVSATYVTSIVLPDLSITKIEPVQVVFGSDIDQDGETDLVLAKSTAVLATVHVLNPSALPARVDLDLQFEGMTYGRGFQSSEVDNNGNVQVVFTLVPSQLGKGQLMTAIVDPSNGIAESDENNNSLSATVSVRQSRPLHVPYVAITDCAGPLHCYGPLDPASAAETMAQSANMIVSTYPVPKVQSTIVATFAGYPVPRIGTRSDMDQAWRIGKRADPQADRVVAVVPQDYFAHHFLTNALGVSSPASNAVLTTVDFWSAPAHEIGHTFCLGRDSMCLLPAEEYVINPPGNCATGYNVANNTQVIDGICFMGTFSLSSPQMLDFQTACYTDTTVKDRRVWIDEGDYLTLFRNIKVPADPEILIVTGTLFEDGSIQLSPWYIAQNGTSTTVAKGPFTLEFTDQAGRVVSATAFSATFSLELDPLPTTVHTGASLFAFSIPLPSGILMGQVRNGPTILTRFDLTTKLLVDAAGSIPDSGFFANPAQRRNALINKVQAIGKMITAGALTGAQAALTNDLKPALNRWLTDDYTSQSPLDVSKTEIIALVDEIISRLSNAQ